MATAETLQLGPLIRRYRLAAGLSQEELAERSGVSARAVSDMERGLRSAPRFETIRLLADGLELSADNRAALIASARPELRELSDSSPPPQQATAARSTSLPLMARPLPAPSDPLFGRNQDIAQTVALLMKESVRLVTLTGPGGVGKTRLSLAVATQTSAGFADAVAFVDLSALTHADQVAAAIASALGITVDPRLPVREALIATLRERSLLLVLDNFEQLLDAAPLISELLTACPSLNILATSRVRLRLRGEHVVPVQPLPVPEPSNEQGEALLEHVSNNPAVQLFVDRALEARFGFALDAQNAAAIAGICRQLDGLPLAIELAASRVGQLPPVTLLERLNQRLPTLSAGARDAPARHRTLRDAIAWSFNLLSPGQQTVFRRIAVFAGGFTLEAAESVAGDPGSDVPAAIETLAESSLLSVTHVFADEPRFTMLDTIHEFAASLLEQSGESHSIRRRHANWYVQVAETGGVELYQCRSETVWYRTLDAEQPNIRTAIDFLLESGDGDSVVRLLAAPAAYWTDRPYPRDLRRWLEEAIALSTEPPSDATVLALALLVLATSFLGDHEIAASIANRQLQLAETIGSPLALGLSYFWQGVIAEYSGNMEQATIDYERALPLFRKAGYLYPVLDTMFELGSIWLMTGKVEQAASILDEGLALARQAAAETELAQGFVYRAFAALAQNDPALAAQFFDEGLIQAQRYRMDRITLGAIGGLSGVALSLDQPELAARLLGAVEAARQTSGVGRISEASVVEAISTATREHLGTDAFEIHIAEGGTMAYEQAIASALEIAELAGERPAAAT